MEDENIQKQDLSEDGTGTEAQTVDPSLGDGTEAPTDVPALLEELQAEDVSGELNAEILTEVKAGNEILGKMYAVEVFTMAFMLFLFVYLIIKNNATRHY